MPDTKPGQTTYDVAVEQLTQNNLLYDSEPSATTNLEEEEDTFHPIVPRNRFGDEELQQHVGPAADPEEDFDTYIAGVRMRLQAAEQALVETSGPTMSGPAVRSNTDFPDDDDDDDDIFHPAVESIVRAPAVAGKGPQVSTQSTGFAPAVLTPEEENSAIVQGPVLRLARDEGEPEPVAELPGTKSRLRQVQPIDVSPEELGLPPLKPSAMDFGPFGFPGEHGAGGVAKTRVLRPRHALYGAQVSEQEPQGHRASMNVGSEPPKGDDCVIS